MAGWDVGGTGGSSSGSGIPATIFDAKGDLIAASAADTAARVAVGTNGFRLQADSTAAGGVSWAGEALIRKTADEAVNNSTVFQNDDHLVLPVLANETWQFEVVLYCSTATGTSTDLKFQWTVPASATMVWGVPGTGTNNYWLAATTATSPTLLVSEAGTVAVGAVNGGTFAMALRGKISVAGTAGNMQLQWAQNTAGAEDTKLLKDSHIRAYRLATS